MKKNPAAVSLGRLGGSARSRAKTAAARRNAKLGGWPKGKRRSERRMPDPMEEPDKSWFSTDAHLRRLHAISQFQKPVGYRNTTGMTDLELEKLVAKRVFQTVDPHRVFRYADNLNDAHRVIEHMRKLNFVVRLDNGLDGTWEATFYKNAETAHGPNDQFYAPEGTLARAICVSALKAVGAPEMEGADE